MWELEPLTQEEISKMTSPEPQKHREFWIDHTNVENNDDILTMAPTNFIDEYTHVIEYSALASRDEEIRKLRLALKDAIEVIEASGRAAEIKGIGLLYFDKARMLRETLTQTEGGRVMSEQIFGQPAPKNELERAKLEIELLKMQLKQSQDNAMLAGKLASEYAADLSLQIRKLQVENRILKKQRKKLTDDLFFRGADAADEIDRLDAEIQEEVEKVK